MHPHLGSNLLWSSHSGPQNYCAVWADSGNRHPEWIQYCFVLLLKSWAWTCVVEVEVGLSYTGTLEECDTNLHIINVWISYVALT